jgi:hypothetical protein
MRTELAHLLRVLEERRGKECDMHHLARYYALDVSGEKAATFSSFLIYVRIVPFLLWPFQRVYILDFVSLRYLYNVVVVVIVASNSMHSFPASKSLSCPCYQSKSISC